MDTLNYRLAKEADTAAISAFSIESYGPFERVLTEEHRAKMKHSMTNLSILEELMNMATTFVCEAGSALAGVVWLVPSGNPTDIYPANRAYIRRLGVHTAYRGRSGAPVNGGSY
jgi:hypothetical protein